MIIYLAGPLFSLAERRFNEEFAKALEQSLLPSMVILPQDHAAKIGEAAGFAERMYCFALDAINHSDAVVAILDGADSDSGTCIEIGYAKAKGKLVIGVRTDFRSGEDRGLNLMVSNICSHLVVRPQHVRSRWRNWPRKLPALWPASSGRFGRPKRPCNRLK